MNGARLQRRLHFKQSRCRIEMALQHRFARRGSNIAVRILQKPPTRRRVAQTSCDNQHVIDLRAAAQNRLCGSFGFSFADQRDVDEQSAPRTRRIAACHGETELRRDFFQTAVKLVPKIGAQTIGNRQETKAATGRAPIAAMSETLTLSALRPSARGELQSRRKCTPSTRQSHVTTGTCKAFKTAPSSPMPTRTPARTFNARF